jgi:hypothetical protein
VLPRQRLGRTSDFPESSPVTERVTRGYRNFPDDLAKSLGWGDAHPDRASPPLTLRADRRLAWPASAQPCRRWPAQRACSSIGHGLNAAFGVVARHGTDRCRGRGIWLGRLRRSARASRLNQGFPGLVYGCGLHPTSSSPSKVDEATGCSVPEIIQTACSRSVTDVLPFVFLASAHLASIHRFQYA